MRATGCSLSYLFVMCCHGPGIQIEIDGEFISRVVCFGKYLQQDYRSNFTRDMMIAGCQIALEVELMMVLHHKKHIYSDY